MRIINRFQFGGVYTILIAIILAEAIVLYGNYSFLLISVWKWIYLFVGPVIFPMSYYAYEQVHAIYRLRQMFATDISDKMFEYYKMILNRAGIIFPALGILGTVAGLFYNLPEIDSLIKKNDTNGVMITFSSCLGSTIVGIIFSIIATHNIERFQYLWNCKKNNKNKGGEMEYDYEEIDNEIFEIP